MPIYEFKCKKCHQTFEQLLIGSDKPVCTSCKSSDVIRLMSVCGFVSRNGSGETVSSSASATSCSGCTAGSCSSCGS